MLANGETLRKPTGSATCCNRRGVVIKDGADGTEWALADGFEEQSFWRELVAYHARESAVMKERLYLYDTTLRDGQQTQGVQFSIAEKLRIAAALDALGVDYIEGGWPGANPTDSGVLCRGGDRPGRA